MEMEKASTEQIITSRNQASINRLLKEAKFKDVVLYRLDKLWFFRTARLAALSQLAFWSYFSYVYVTLLPKSER
jgi:hypothetical protein